MEDSLKISDKIEIHKGYTLSGLTINVVSGEYCLTINENDNIFINDSYGEVIIDKEIIPEFDINNITKEEIENIFHLSVSYLNFIRNYLKKDKEPEIITTETNQNNDIT